MIKVSTNNREVDQALREQCSRGLESLLGDRSLGFHQLPEREENWLKVREVAGRLQASFESFVFVGIGGSGLGGKTIRDAFSHLPESDQIHFLENLDSYTVDSVFRKIDPRETAFIFVSKSGSTLETLALANEVCQRLSKESDAIGLRGRTVVITENKPSPLFDWGQSLEAHHLEIPEDVGGRFSVLTPVGLLVASVLGLEIQLMRQGAMWARNQQDLIANLSAHSLASFQREEWISQFWVYSDRLATFGSWMQQLWAESLDKRVDNGGSDASRVSTPMGCVGAIDQHSLLQQVMEGARDKWVLGFRIEENHRGNILENQFVEQRHLDNQSLSSILNAEASATLQAMMDEGVSLLELTIERLDEESLGAMFMLFQLVVGTIGTVLNINAFDQPGVEKGKALAKRLLLDSENRNASASTS